MDPLTTTRKTIEAIWRIEAARLVGGLLRVVHDLALAEDLAQEALLKALERWPQVGVPTNPGAWLMTTARNAAVDELRRRSRVEGKHAALQREGPPLRDEAALGEGGVGAHDDVLRLILITCHPVLSREARVALTLRLVAGLSTAEIARAQLCSEVTLAQRLVRAKRTLSEAKVPFELPVGEELNVRLPSALEVVYLVFNEGYVATYGERWLRTELCEEALRLGRMLSALVPQEAEVHGLLSLMELQASRSRARVGPRGEVIPLGEQRRSRWDHLQIQRGLAALERAQALGRPLGVYTLQAAIAACHAQASSPEQTPWERIVALYDALVQLTGSPVVELNRAVAVAMAYGAAEGLALVEALADEPLLKSYHLLPAVRADLLSRLGRSAEARQEWERAAHLATNGREKELLLARATSCVASAPPDAEGGSHMN